METSRSGRARKKTAKMLEMEEVEEELSYAVKVVRLILLSPRVFFLNFMPFH